MSFKTLGVNDKMALESISSQEGKKFGIENLKKVQIWKAELIKEIYRLMKKKKEGKRVTGWAIVMFFDDAISLGKILSKLEETGEEFQDLNSEEIKELNDIFHDRLKDIPEKYRNTISKLNLMVTTVADGILDIFDEFNS